MRIAFPRKLLIMSMVILCNTVVCHAQKFLSDYDSTIFMRDTLRPFLRRMEPLHFSGYVQPQFQVAQSKGAPSYNGGNFSEFANNRFMLRRARIKLDYILIQENLRLPQIQLTFQIDATERGVNVRDMFVRVYGPNRQRFYATMGLFARPFGYEVNLSSAYREVPERGRMSQILMPTERDLGFMVSYEFQRKSQKTSFLKWDAGVFNGEGLSGPSEFDSFKDIISRLTLKPRSIGNELLLSGGLSLLYGGWRQATKYRYEMSTTGNEARFAVDSSNKNIGAKAPRHYYGADLQVVKKYGWGKTEVRGEYWKGKQPGTAITTTNPGVMPLEPTFIRPFDGAFFYFIQSFGRQDWELVLKYDWYDPNKRVSGAAIGKPGTGLGVADVRFNTVGLGINKYFNKSLKLLLYYDIVRNERTAVTGYTEDLKDNIFTARLQMMF